jgi:ABC-type transport system involved in cytochrome c biogenesis permease subunit
MLRECQSRSAREQQILSGRDWLFVTALVQFLSALFPIYRCVIHVTRTTNVSGTFQEDMGMAIGMCVVSIVLTILWWWGKYAPFRAAYAAFAFYLALHILVAVFYPTDMFNGIASKVLVTLGLIMAVRTGYRRRHSG